jgi:hypothetical protein
VRSLVAGVVIAVAGAAFVLVFFQPQDLFINHTVDEALPGPSTSVAPSAAAPGRPASAPAEEPAVGQPHGRFTSGEHDTSGLARVVSVPGSGTYLRLTDFRTSNGPAVHVWLSTAAAGVGNGDIRSAPHLDLGDLKGNIGNQNYLVPAGTDLTRYRLVVIWCQRFHVAFGSAPLT